MSAWIVRHGVNGEHEEWALTNGRAAIGFDEVGDLTEFSDKAQVRVAVDAAYPTAPTGRQIVYTSQLWAMRGGIQPGELVIMPMKTTRKLAIGVCASGCEYLTEESHHRRHTIKVDWKTRSVSRSGVKQDPLNTLNGAMTVFQASRNNAEDRLRALLDSGVDPGGPEAGETAESASVVEGEAVDPTPEAAGPARLHVT